MKKIKLMFVLLAMSLLCFSSNAFAESALSSGGTTAGELEIGSAGTAVALVIGMSPKVVGAYFTDGTDQDTAQWYAVGTVHPGGSKLYGTAQNLTNTYTKDFATGTTINADLFGLPSGPNSASDWVTNDWTL